MSNFLNLFNQVNNLFSSIAGSTLKLNAGLNKAVSFTETVVGGALGANTVVPPQVDLSKTPAKTEQQTDIINKQLQASILETQEALKEFTQEDKSALVKEMLSLPKDYSALVKSLQNQNQNLTNTEFLKLLAMLNINGKEALSKLSKLLVIFGNNNLNGADQLQELYTIINACVSSSSTTASQLVKNMILLYLPWLPIGECNSFDLTMEETQNNKTGDSEDQSDSIVIFIQTVNFSNVKVTLFKEPTADVKMLVECSEAFPKKELYELVNMESKTVNINADITFAKYNTQNQTNVKNTNFNVNVSKFLNPYLMIMAQVVIKSVIQIDKRTSLISKRQQSMG